MSCPTWEQLTAELHEAILTGSADPDDLSCFVEAIREAVRTLASPSDSYGPEAFYWPGWVDIDGDGAHNTEPEAPSLASVIEAERAVVRARFFAAGAAAAEDGRDVAIGEDVEYLNGKLAALDWVLSQLAKQKGTVNA